MSITNYQYVHILLKTELSTIKYADYMYKPKLPVGHISPLFFIYSCYEIYILKNLYSSCKVIYISIKILGNIAITFGELLSFM